MDLPEQFHNLRSNWSRRLLAVAVFVLLPLAGLYAQGGSGADTLRTPAVTADPAAAPDTVIAADTALSDSAKVQSKEERLGIKISRDALPAAVTTIAKDSAVLDMQHSMFYLYGDAQANYEEIQIKSGQLIFDQKSNVLSAVPTLDTAGKKASTQEFKQGEETFTYDTLRYNFKSKRAIVRNAHSQYGDGFVISEQVKRNPDESIYGYKSIYTTCNLDHPHFGIRARRIKVIPGRIIASGPANLEVMDIPTPLMLPFGLFPIKQGQRSGFILPTYTIEERKGVGLQRLGYYFAINDYVGLISQFDIFSKGSWAVYTTTQYAKRYQYNGNLSVNYSYLKTGELYETNSSIERDFKVSWTHQVDPKARPGTTFSASVNVGTRSFNSLNNINLTGRLNNDYNSSISYGKTWIGKPYSLSVSMRHSQSTQTGALTIGFPEAVFNLGQFSPFQRKVMAGTPRWYEKITATYSVNIINRLNTYDSLFSLRNISFADMDNGIKHTASVQANYNIFRYLNWSIQVPYTEYWNTKQLYLRRNPDKTVDSSARTGFFATRDFNLNSSLSTRIYGMKLFKRGKIAGIRHVLTPTVGFTYTPGFAHSPFGYMYETTDGYGGIAYRSPYANTPIGGPMNPNNQGALSFGLGNTLQMKVRNTDSAGKAGTKIISLIDAFGVNARYDLFADSFNMSNISLNFRTSVLNIINISASAVYDPYQYVNGRKTRHYIIENGSGIAKLRSAQAGLGMTFQGDKSNRQEQEEAEKNNSEVKRLLQNGGYNDYYDFGIPWNLSVNAGISINRDVLSDTLVVTPNLTFNGGFNLSERWKVSVNSGLQFEYLNKVSLGPTQIDISRDLHCWQMSLNLIPFGYYRSFNFTLQVKSAVLQDLKLTRRRNFTDNF